MAKSSGRKARAGNQEAAQRLAAPTAACAAWGLMTACVPSSSESLESGAMRPAVISAVSQARKHQQKRCYDSANSYLRCKHDRK